MKQENLNIYKINEKLTSTDIAKQLLDLVPKHFHLYYNNFLLYYPNKYISHDFIIHSYNKANILTRHIAQAGGYTSILLDQPFRLEIKERVDKIKEILVKNKYIGLTYEYLGGLITNYKLGILSRVPDLMTSVSPTPSAHQYEAAIARIPFIIYDSKLVREAYITVPINSGSTYYQNIFTHIIRNNILKGITISVIKFNKYFKKLKKIRYSNYFRYIYHNKKYTKNNISEWNNKTNLFYNKYLTKYNSEVYELLKKPFINPKIYLKLMTYQLQWKNYRIYLQFYPKLINKFTLLKPKQNNLYIYLKRQYQLNLKHKIKPLFVKSVRRSKKHMPKTITPYHSQISLMNNLFFFKYTIKPYKLLYKLYNILNKKYDSYHTRFRIYRGLFKNYTKLLCESNFLNTSKYPKNYYKLLEFKLNTKERYRHIKIRHFRRRYFKFNKNTKTSHVQTIRKINKKIFFL